MSSLCCLPLLSSWNNEHLSKLLINTHPQENKIMLPANRLCEYMLALLFCFWLLLSSWDDSIWQQNSKTFTSVTHKKKVCCICKSNLNIFVNLFHTVTGLYIGRNYPTLKKKKLVHSYIGLFKNIMGEWILLDAVYSFMMIYYSC